MQNKMMQGGLLAGSKLPNALRNVKVFNSKDFETINRFWGNKNKTQ